MNIECPLFSNISNHFSSLSHKWEHPINTWKMSGPKKSGDLCSEPCNDLQMQTHTCNWGHYFPTCLQRMWPWCHRIRGLDSYLKITSSNSLTKLEFVLSISGELSIGVRLMMPLFRFRYWDGHLIGFTPFNLHSTSGRYELILNDKEKKQVL